MITIGRDPHSTIVIDESWNTVSNNHADIESTPNGLVFYDHSSNGTLINGQKVHNKHVNIYSGDKIMLAGVFLLEWHVIEAYVPRQPRPTVTRNIHAEQPQPAAALPGNSRNEALKGRPTSQRVSAVTPPPRPAAGSEVNRPTPPPQMPSAPKCYSQAEIDRVTSSWNWGAFFCTWIWAACHKMYWPLAIIVVGLIPYLGQVASLCLAVYLGAKGSKIAWTCGRYYDFDSYRRAQKSWAIGGLILFVVSLIIQFFALQSMLNIF